MLCFGHAGGGTKADKPYAAGHFGEGMKVQINRLIVDRKVSVTYTTGICAWDFSHACAPHCEMTTLHVRTNRLAQHHGHPSLDPHRLEETVCSIRGSSALFPPLNNSQFLFLQPPQSLQGVELASTDVPAKVKTSPLLSSVGQWYPRVRVEDSANQFGMEFLFKPEFHGRFYIHDILLKEVGNEAYGPELHGMGINFTGSTKTLLAYKLNRNRNSADVEGLLCTMVVKAIDLLSQQTSVDGQLGPLYCLVAHLYQELLAMHTIFRGLQYRAPSKCTAELLCRFLGPSQGLPFGSMPPPFPCSMSSSTAQESELWLLGYQPVKVRQAGMFLLLCALNSISLCIFFGSI